MDKFKEILLLSNIRGIGPVSINKTYLPIISNFNSYDEFRDSLAEILPERFHKYLEEAISETEKIADQTKENSISPITILDKNYPEKLKDLNFKAPPILYAKGNIKLLSQPATAIVGTRNPSKQAISYETDLIKSLKTTVISGLAPGTDSIAHKTALRENLPTIAVLPAGLENIYPKENVPLAEEIVDSNGTLVTSYRPFERLHRAGYITRNKYIAALADKIYTTEFSIESGTIYTVNDAMELNREISIYLPEDLGQGDFSGNISILNSNSKSIKRIS